MGSQRLEVELELIRRKVAVLDAATETDITAHLTDTTPHPVYDDMTSLTLNFENALA